MAQQQVWMHSAALAVTAVEEGGADGLSGKISGLAHLPPEYPGRVLQQKSTVAVLHPPLLPRQM